MRGFAQILGPHDHTLAIHRQYQNGSRLRIGASACLALGVKRLEILRRPDHQFLELTLGHVRAGIYLQRLHPLVKRALGRFDRYSPPHFQRVLLRRQMERTVQRVLTGCACGSIAGAGHLHLAEEALQTARMDRGGRERRARRIPHRFDRLARLAHVQMRLKQFPQQLPPHPLQLSFQFARLHLPRLLRTQELGDCRIGWVRCGKPIRHRTGQGAHGSPSYDSPHRAKCPALFRINPDTSRLYWNPER